MIALHFAAALALAGAMDAATRSDEPPGPRRESAEPIAGDRALAIGAGGAGSWLPDLEFTDADGTPGRVADAVGANGLVVAIRDATCPLSRRYGPRLAEIERAFTDRGVRFLFVDPFPHDDAAALRADRERFGFAGRCVVDEDGALAGALAVRTSTEVFLFDRARTLRYRGAVDDQYGIGFALPAPRRRYLADALGAVLAGAPVAVPMTSAPGCRLERPAAPAAVGAVTYHATISRIVQARCLSCHRPGAVGPFALDGHAPLAGRRGMVRHVVEEGIMPPWHAEGGGPWANDRSLAPAERDAIVAWIDAGCPEGDPADAPLPRVFPDAWEIGTPDVVYEIPATFRIPAEGAVEYQYVSVETDLPEDRWVKAIEIRPTAPAVVHHALVFVEKAGTPSRESGLLGYFAALVPGQGPTIFPDGLGKKLPKNATLTFQLHYTPNGTVAFDQTRVGIVFADAPPERVMQTAAVVDRDFVIPPGAASHRVTASSTFRRAGTLVGFAPHMHLRGKAFRFDLTLPDGTTETILDVPRYDFEWQAMYRLATPRRVEPGTVMTCTAWFDNSSDNPANPDPAKAVTFGEQTWDEMMIGYFEWYAD
jgi:mono/diheme cytochrome c family protein